MTDISLREFIIETICHSGYGARQYDGDKLEEVATNLGVLPETILAACARRKERKVEAGIERTVGKQGMSYQYHTHSIGITTEAKILWEAYAAKRGMAHSTLCRSIIHSYLKSSYEPELRGTSWSVRGALYKGKYIYTKVNITHAAKLVLTVRASARRSSISGLVRALMIETMEGKISKPGSFDLVTRSQMYSDPMHYYAPSVAGVPKNMSFEGQVPRERLVESYEREPKPLEENDQ